MALGECALPAQTHRSRGQQSSQVGNLQGRSAHMPFPLYNPRSGCSNMHSCTMCCPTSHSRCGICPNCLLSLARLQGGVIRPSVAPVGDCRLQATGVHNWRCRTQLHVCTIGHQHDALVSNDRLHRHRSKPSGLPVQHSPHTAGHRCGRVLFIWNRYGACGIAAQICMPCLTLVTRGCQSYIEHMMQSFASCGHTFWSLRDQTSVLHKCHCKPAVGMCSSVCPLATPVHALPASHTCACLSPTGKWLLPCSSPPCSIPSTGRGSHGQRGQVRVEVSRNAMPTVCALCISDYPSVVSWYCLEHSPDVELVTCVHPHYTCLYNPSVFDQWGPLHQSTPGRC
jgi:hypothetical protein